MRLYCHGQLRPEMFPGIGDLPKPATEPHVVNRRTPVAPYRLKKKSHPRGKPLQSSFPKYHELFEEPHHCKGSGNSLTAKAASIWDLRGLCSRSYFGPRACGRGITIFTHKKNTHSDDLYGTELGSVTLRMA